MIKRLVYCHGTYVKYTDFVQYKAYAHCVLFFVMNRHQMSCYYSAVYKSLQVTIVKAYLLYQVQRHTL